MAVAAQKQIEEANFYALAREACEDAETRDAALVAVEKAIESQGLKKAFSAWAIKKSIQELVRDVFHKTRLRYPERAIGDSEARSVVSGLDGLAESNRRDMMGWRLQSGEILADAKRIEILDEAEYYARQTRSYYKRELLFMLIFHALPDDKTPVSKVLNEDELVKLYREAQEQAEDL